MWHPLVMFLSVYVSAVPLATQAWSHFLVVYYEMLSHYIIGYVTVLTYFRLWNLSYYFLLYGKKFYYSKWYIFSSCIFPNNFVKLTWRPLSNSCMSLSWSVDVYDTIKSSAQYIKYNTLCIHSSIDFVVMAKLESGSSKDVHVPDASCWLNIAFTDSKLATTRASLQMSVTIRVGGSDICMLGAYLILVLDKAIDRDWRYRKWYNLFQLCKLSYITYNPAS